VRFVLLSMLLHATIVILFGTSHGGGAGRGEGMLDVIDVTFRRLPSLPEAGLQAGPGAETTTGRGLFPRVDPQATVPPPRSEPLPPLEAAKPEPAPASVPPMPPPAVEPLPRIDLRAPQEVDKPLLPPLIAPPAIERLAPPPNPADLAPPPDLAPPAIPLVPAAPIERLTAPAVQHELAPPIEIAPAPNLVAPGPSVAAPPETAPAEVERTAPPVSARPAPAASESAAPAADTRTAPGARSAPATAAPPPRLRLGAPAPDEDIFKPRRDVAAPGEDGVPRIDMEAARQRAREIASETTSTRGILPALPPPPERQSKESHALEKAVKPDCRTAYAGQGLLAVPVLVASTIGDAGCRW
jgi:hypothetical protein